MIVKRMFRLRGLMREALYDHRAFMSKKGPFFTVSVTGPDDEREIWWGKNEMSAHAAHAAAEELIALGQDVFDFEFDANGMPRQKKFESTPEPPHIRKWLTGK